MKTTLPKLKGVIEIVCPPSIICLTCTLWNNMRGCENGRDTEQTTMAIYGCCPKMKPIK